MLYIHLLVNMLVMTNVISTSNIKFYLYTKSFTNAKLSQTVTTIVGFLC